MSIKEESWFETILFVFICFCLGFMVCYAIFDPKIQLLEQKISIIECEMVTQEAIIPFVNKVEQIDSFLKSEPIITITTIDGIHERESNEDNRLGGLIPKLKNPPILLEK